jgi:hypothetical protein
MKATLHEGLRRKVSLAHAGETEDARDMREALMPYSEQPAVEFEPQNENQPVFIPQSGWRVPVEVPL